MTFQFPSPSEHPTDIKIPSLNIIATLDLNRASFNQRPLLERPSAEFLECLLNQALPLNTRIASALELNNRDLSREGMAGELVIERLLSKITQVTEREPFQMTTQENIDLNLAIYALKGSASNSLLLREILTRYLSDDELSFLPGNGASYTSLSETQLQRAQLATMRVYTGLSIATSLDVHDHFMLERISAKARSRELFEPVKVQLIATLVGIDSPEIAKTFLSLLCTVNKTSGHEFHELLGYLGIFRPTSERLEHELKTIASKIPDRIKRAQLDMDHKLERYLRQTVPLLATALSPIFGANERTEVRSAMSVDAFLRGMGDYKKQIGSVEPPITLSILNPSPASRKYFLAMQRQQRSYTVHFIDHGITVPHSPYLTE